MFLESPPDCGRVRRRCNCLRLGALAYAALDFPRRVCQPAPMPPASTPPLTLRDLLALSEFARAFPRRAAELLDRCVDPLMEDRPERRKESRGE